MWAIMGSNLHIVKLLVDSGSNYQITDSQGMSPLMISVQKGYLFISHYLTSIGDSVNHKDNSGHSMVHWASYSGHLNVVKYLVEVKGLSVMDLDSKGRIPLHWAAKQGHIEVCKYLIMKV
jgi:ankyrin repeat protein